MKPDENGVDQIFNLMTQYDSVSNHINALENADDGSLGSECKQKLFQTLKSTKILLLRR